MKNKLFLLGCLAIALTTCGITAYAAQTDIGFGFNKETNSSSTEPSSTGSSSIEPSSTSSSSTDQVKAMNYRNGGNGGNNGKYDTGFFGKVLPKTGMRQNTYYIYIGLLFIGGALYLFNRKGRRGEGE
ncbi:LPXTG cell wall anchor domain-containing protein [Enterococcus gilvus]|uniref:LPXTG cell wall anchor domain-containing protein n=1 Tax=Enterococcus gilvus TaxID=160453 RepID=UPI001C8BDF19|nr:LPXTG cell wall anchor domain-containing protein [Enterococcus gilvus]MBX8935328.1 LPXTG cell wall anchor domain-containing protein [Enterococcus gilvus]